MKLEELSGVELGKKVNSKEISPVEVIKYFEKRVKERNPSINAFVYTKFDEAKEEAKKLESSIMAGNTANPLAGVPVGLKDFLPSKKGWTASHGGVKCMVSVDEYDGAFYSAVKKLGAIAVGKTNAPAFGFRGTTDNKMYGPTSTPFNVAYNSGGSSGGSAAAVADGLVPIAETGDAGGSTRIPSAWCGTFGFKPSFGVVPSVCRPDAWTATHPYCCPGPTSRTVEDAAVVFDAMKGYNPRDPLSIPSANAINAVESLGKSIKDLKVGYTFDFNLFPTPEDDIIHRMCDAIKDIESSVSAVDPVRFDFSYSMSDMEEAWLRGISIDDSVNPEVVMKLKEHYDDFPKSFAIWNELARKSTMQHYLKFHKIRTDILDAHLDVFDKYDIILAPVCGCSPVLNSDNKDTKGPDNISGKPINPLIGFSYCYLENMIGTPAASIPVGLSKNGLPIGLQVIGRRYEDDTVFRFCSALEKIRPWSYEIPYNRM